MNGHNNCVARPVVAADVEQVLRWRNDPVVRSNMLSQHEIGLEEHQRWFQRAALDSTKCLLVVEESGLPLGFVHFSGVARRGVADWGFYAVPGAPKGTGRKLGAAALAHAFKDLGLHKVCGQVLDFNEASLRLHLRLGFVQEGVLRQQARIGNEYRDLICFGLLKHEWTMKEEK